MEIGKVVGNVWATKKADGISGQKLLIIDVLRSIESMRARGQGKEALLVAADVIGAGIGDMVLLCRGNPARMVAGNGNTPVDAAVVGIIDSLDIPEWKNEDGGALHGHQ